MSGASYLGLTASIAVATTLTKPAEDVAAVTPPADAPDPDQLALQLDGAATPVASTIGEEPTPKLLPDLPAKIDLLPRSTTTSVDDTAPAAPATLPPTTAAPATQPPTTAPPLTAPPTTSGPTTAPPTTGGGSAETTAVPTTNTTAPTTSAAPTTTTTAPTTTTSTTTATTTTSEAS